MSERRGFLGEVSWFQLAASVLAAVTAAWIASRLGVAGTLVGAALGSATVTVTSALYARTLDKGRTLLVTTATGTVIQRRVEADGEIAETIDQAGEDAPVERAEFVPDEPAPRLHWKTIAVTTVVVLALALAAITTYELVADRTLDGSKGTTIGDTFGGSKGDPKPSDPTKTPTTTPTTTIPTTTPTPSATTPTPTPSATTPTPTPTETTEPAE
ncbi:hypothetical protein [Aeromicrobium ginsengisoli]|uniref:Uncharacterized protein n=1 Tax=Aeromicrobium ginsengisoli TaxID=363867 RepID=A0A5M4FH65_9ACTN|nr:hypothetical protein [Aeromicrobium ginsengisoli]KAA1398231.1 hypothetical protein ESP70_012975 [Aeromicrobium ginsengisoli]